VASFVLGIWRGDWTTVIPSPPPLLAADASRPPPAGANVAVVSGPGPGSIQLAGLAFPTVWQAEDGFRYRLADAYVGSFPPPLPPAVQRFIHAGSLSAAEARTVRDWIRTARVGEILLLRPTPASEALVERLVGAAPQRTGGDALFPVAPAVP
jgi:hypothetical protein